jgi:hypothetical protein
MTTSRSDSRAGRAGPSARLGARLLAAVAVLAAAPTLAAERVAVLEFTGPALGDDMRRALSDATRAAALEPARAVGYTVMTRESTALVLEQMGGQCTEGQCELEVGRSVGAALVVTGEVRKVEGAYLADLKLHDTQSGALLAVEQCRTGAPLELIDQTRAASGRLLSTGLERYFAKPVPAMRRADTDTRPLRRYYVQLVVDQELSLSAPATMSGGTVPMESAGPMPRGLIGARLTHSWAVELAVGAMNIESSDRSVGYRLEGEWVTLGAAWRPDTESVARLFSIAAQLGMGFTREDDPGLYHSGAPTLNKSYLVPTGGLEARFDYPLGPVALGVRGGGLFHMYVLEGGKTEFFQKWSAGLALTYTFPF